MSGRGGSTVEQVGEREDRGLPLTPGRVVAVLGVLLLVAIAAGIIVNRPDGGPTVETVTIAELRAAPNTYDNQTVLVEGVVDDVRELPYLSQYALYTLRDDTGTIAVLTQHGAPPGDPPGQIFQLEAIYHSRVTLDDELRRIVEDQLGSIAGEIVVRLLPGVPVNVVFLEHQRYEPVMSDEQ